jgi:hypothetical protein
MCNVTGSDPMNVTWSKVGGISYPESFSYSFPSIVRGDEATYKCTAYNGNECPVATATSLITVICKQLHMLYFKRHNDRLIRYIFNISFENSLLNKNKYLINLALHVKRKVCRADLYIAAPVVYAKQKHLNNFNL